MTNPDVDSKLRILGFELEIALNQTSILSNGEVVEGRQLVERLNNNIKIEIYPNEHPPPHFHVKTNEFNVSISILEFRVIKGNLDSNTYKRINYFYNNNKMRLIEAWNKLRPSDCPVGPILL